MNKDANRTGAFKAQGDLEAEYVPVDIKLGQISDMCNIGDFDRARPLLYDVLSDGDESQVKIALGILAQLDA